MKESYFKQKGISGFRILVAVVSILIAVAIITIIIGTGVDVTDLISGIYVQIGLWIFLIGSGLFLVIFGIVLAYVTEKAFPVYVAKIGMILIALSFLVILVNVLLPLFAEQTVTFEECTEIVYLEDVYRTMACIFVGYSPVAEANVTTYISFIISSIIAPFVFFYYIFNDLMRDMAFPRTISARRSIAFVGAYAALRGAFSSYFINFFAYSWLGMGALAFGVFMIMIAWSIVKRFFTGVIDRQYMKKLYDYLSGNKLADPKGFLFSLSKIGFPALWLSKNFAHVEGFFSKIGYEGMVDKLRAMLAEADLKYGKNWPKKNEYVRNKLIELAAT